MRLARDDDPFGGLVDVVACDRLRGDLHAVHDLVCEGIDQPRLTHGQRIGVLDGLGDEPLAGVGGVLPVELTDLVEGEVVQPQGRHLDVERTRRRQPGRIAVRSNPVIADVAQAAENDRRGEAGGAVAVTVAQLAEDAEQGASAEGVNLVEEQHQRSRAGLRPDGERFREEPLRPALRPGRRTQVGRQVGSRGASGTREDRPGGRADVIRPGPARLHRQHDRRVAATRGQFRGERLQRCRLACLAWGVQDEVLLGLDEIGRLGEPLRGRDHVVVARHARPGRVERARHHPPPSHMASVKH